MRRGVLLLGVALPVLAFTLACLGGGDDDEPSERFQGPGGEDLLPIEMTVSPELQTAPQGVAVTADVFITWPSADGGIPPAADAVEVSYGADDQDGCTRQGRWIVEGTHWQWTMKNDNPDGVCRSFVNISVEGATRVSSVRTPGAYLRSLPTRADVVGLPAEHVVLGVDEVRPWSAFAAADGTDWFNRERRVTADVDFTWRIDDPSVATVTEDGVLTGVSPGETTVSVQVDGGAPARATVRVVDVPPGPPPIGHHTVLDFPATARGLTFEAPETFSPATAIEADGNPLFVLDNHDFGIGASDPRPLLLRWTGTGFGVEVLAVGEEATVSAWPATGADGHLYLLVLDRVTRTMQVWDRPVDVVRGGWRKRDVPLRLDRFGQPVLTVGPRYGVGSSGATRIRTLGGGGTTDPYGEGALFGWSVLIDSDGRCRGSLMAARVTPDSLDVEALYSVDIPEVTAGSCEDQLAPYVPTAMHWEQTPLDDAWPMLIGGGGAWVREPSGWREQLAIEPLGRDARLPPSPDELAALGLPDRFGDPLLGAYDLEVALPVHPGHPPEDDDRALQLLDTTRVETPFWGGRASLGPVDGDTQRGERDLHVFIHPLLDRPAAWKPRALGQVPQGGNEAVTLGADGEVFVYSSTLGLLRLDDAGEYEQQVLFLARQPGFGPYLWTALDGPRGIDGARTSVVRPDAPAIDLGGTTEFQTNHWSTNARGDLWAVTITPGEPDAGSRLIRVPGDSDTVISVPVSDRVTQVHARPDGGAIVLVADFPGTDRFWTWYAPDGTIERTLRHPPASDEVPNYRKVDGDGRIFGLKTSRPAGLVLTEDDGATWVTRQLVETSLEHAWFDVLDDGRIAVAGTVPRNGYPDWPAVWITGDGGRTWDGPTWLEGQSTAPVQMPRLTDLERLPDGTWLSIHGGPLLETPPER